MLILVFPLILWKPSTKKAHEAIRKDPTKVRDPLEKGYFAVKRTKGKAKDEKFPHKHFNQQKIHLKQRRARVAQILTHRGVAVIAAKDA